MESLSGIYWEMLLVQDIELGEAILMASEMVGFLEDLGYLILVTDQMGRLLENFGRVHCEGYFVNIVELREAHPLGWKMTETREASLLVSGYVVSRYGEGYPCK